MFDREKFEQSKYPPDGDHRKSQRGAESRGAHDRLSHEPGKRTKIGSPHRFPRHQRPSDEAHATGPDLERLRYPDEIVPRPLLTRMPHGHLGFVVLQPLAEHDHTAERPAAVFHELRQASPQRDFRLRRFVGGNGERPGEQRERAWPYRIGISRFHVHQACPDGTRCAGHSPGMRMKSVGGPHDGWPHAALTHTAHPSMGNRPGHSDRIPALHETLQRRKVSTEY